MLRWPLPQGFLGWRERLHSQHPGPGVTFSKMAETGHYEYHSWIAFTAFLGDREPSIHKLVHPSYTRFALTVVLWLICPQAKKARRKRPRPWTWSNSLPRVRIVVLQLAVERSSQPDLLVGRMRVKGWTRKVDIITCICLLNDKCCGFVFDCELQRSHGKPRTDSVITRANHSSFSEFLA